jgi:hypothetical protein
MNDEFLPRTPTTKPDPGPPEVPDRPDIPMPDDRPGPAERLPDELGRPIRDVPGHHGGGGIVPDLEPPDHPF